MFVESDPTTWTLDKELPLGYYWRDLQDGSGEAHLIAPDGRNLSQIYWDKVNELRGFEVYGLPGPEVKRYKGELYD
jgi:hypothetical protein